MTVPTNVPRGSYGPKGDIPPVVPWLGVAAAPPTIPKLYWGAYSDEQRIKALWACFNGLADRVNQLGYYYLPDFQGEWDRTKEYPPLSVVQAPSGIEGVKAGDSYTAIDWVPVGTPLTDTTYWAKTGNYNAQLAEVQAAANNAQTAADNAQTAADNAQTAANNAQTAADNAQTAADNAQKTANLIMKNIVTFGDSWLASLNLGNLILSHLKNANIVKNYAISGAQFGPSNLSSVADSTGSELATAINDDSVDRSTISDVVIIAGVNNIGNGLIPTTSQIEAHINSFMEAYPNAIIHVIFNSKRACYNNQDQNPGDWYNPFISGSLAAGAHVSENSPFWIKTNEEATFWDGNDYTNRHPNNTGLNVFARIAASFIETGKDRTYMGVIPVSINYPGITVFNALCNLIGRTIHLKMTLTTSNTMNGENVIGSIALPWCPAGMYNRWMAASSTGIKPIAFDVNGAGQFTVISDDSAQGFFTVEAQWNIF